MRVLVIGAGIIGNAVAWRLARSGVEVAIVERGRAGQEASWAAAGMIAPQAETEGSGPFLRFCVEGKKAFEAILPELIAESGVDPEYDRGSGVLYLALNEKERAELAARAAWQREAGLQVEEISGERARAITPAISPQAIYALYFPHENRVENRQLTQAFLTAALKAGAKLIEDSGVDSIEIRGGKFSGLRLHDGELIEGDAAVNAAGSWASMIRGIEADNVRLHPVRGQIVCFQARPNLVGPSIFSLRGYAVPRRDGRVLAGSTREMARYSKDVTLEGMESIVRAARDMLPTLGTMRFREAWAGLRPATADFLPVLGPSPSVPGFFYATGHFRSGILLAAITGQVMAAMLSGGRPEADIGHFSPARFNNAGHAQKD
ncbi:MAG TPA: glycine oxidase ThiO [Candidatus Binataceae bacterium]|jgi:glycine oxidase|nr:glycine oxidase ThiO [Candidatus Binataceae bacterium]